MAKRPTETGTGSSPGMSYIAKPWMILNRNNSIVKRRKSGLVKEEEYDVDAIVGERCTSHIKGVEYRVKWKGYAKATWEPESNLSCSALLKKFKMDKLRQSIRRCNVAPSKILDAQLCFETLTGEIDWKVPRICIPVKRITPRTPSSGLTHMTEVMSTTFREGGCEQALYPRAACILLEMVDLYRDLVPEGKEVKIHPVMTFKGTDKATDYVVIVVSASDTGKEERPIMIFEIKRSVNGDLSRVGIGGLSQTLLESCYCGLQYKTRQIIACLTDVATWHFIKCECPLSDPQMVVVTAATTVTTHKDYETLIHAMAGMLLNELDNWQ